jgi:hypothetical protein
VIDDCQVVVRLVQFVCVTVAESVPVLPATTLKVVGATATLLTTHWGGVISSPPPPHPYRMASVPAVTAERTVEEHCSR